MADAKGNNYVLVIFDSCRYDTFVEEFSSILQRQAHLRHRDADPHADAHDHAQIQHDEDED